MTGTVQKIQAIDSHTAGEPTRVVIDCEIDLGGGAISDRLDRFRKSFDHYRKSIVLEPRGSDPVVGALLCEPYDARCDVAVIFFNNVGFLGMCGHGMIGVVETLKHLGRMKSGSANIETPVGVVTTTSNEDGSVSFENVPSYRKKKDVIVDTPSFGKVRGDIAWGGNWFYLVHDPGFEISYGKRDKLTEAGRQIRAAVNQAGFPEVDHVELFSSQKPKNADAQNFVLCPGSEYDRSPCGTGTSAKLACLAAERQLDPGQEWIQAGILGTCFRGRYRWLDQHKRKVTPTITGRAYVTGETSLILNPEDPFRWGIGDEA